MLLQALDAGHPFNLILRAWLTGRFVWVVSTPILLEYEEVITRLNHVARWHRFLRFIELARAAGSSMEQVSSSYQFRIISADPDDNNFTDCAISANADFVVTEDRHFAALENAGFRPQPIAPMEFIRRHLSKESL